MTRAEGADPAPPGRSPAFRLLLTARAVSGTGDAFTSVALPFAVLGVTHSAADVGYVLAARTTPMVVLLLFGGVLADRAPKRSVLLAGANLVRCASQAGLAAALLTGTASLVLMMALMAIYGAVGALANPAQTGLVPAIVPPTGLQRANALLGLTDSTSSLAGPALAGVLVASITPGGAIAVDAASFAVAAACFVILRPAGTVTLASKDEPVLAQLRRGWQEVRGRSWLWGSILSFAVFQFVGLGPLYVLGPAIAERFLGGAFAWGVLLAAAGLGSIAGNLAGLRLRPRRPLVAMSMAILGCVPSIVLLAVAAPVAWIAVAEVAFGAGLAFADTMWFTVLQERVPQDALARVSAYDWLGSTALRPLGQIAAGPVGAAVGVQATLVGAAALIAGSGLLLVRSRGVRELRRPASELPASEQGPGQAGASTSNSTHSGPTSTGDDSRKPG